jgi:hypothetical protein
MIFRVASQSETIIQLIIATTSHNFLPYISIYESTQRFIDVFLTE